MIYHINAIDLNTDIADVNGTKWFATKISGWSSAAVRKSSLNPPSRHGVVTTEGLYGARYITLEGVAKSASTAGHYAADYYLQSQTAGLLPVTAFTFSVEEDIRRQVTVVRDAELKTDLIGVGAFTFMLTLRADDPFKYAYTASADTLAAGVGETHVNAGSARTYPVFTLTAGGTPTITVGSQSWVANSALPSGTVIDMKAMTVLSGGTSYLGSVNLSSNWLYYDTGNNTVTSSVAASVAWRSAWY